MKRLCVRLFQPGDAPEVVRIHNESRDSFEDEKITPEFINILSEREDYSFFIASSGKRVAGYCGVLYHPSYGRAEVGPIVVDVRHRRKGVARTLLSETFGLLRDRDIRRITVRVKVRNEPAVRFFESEGFEREGYFREYTRDREDVVQLVAFI